MGHGCRRQQKAEQPREGASLPAILPMSHAAEFSYHGMQYVKLIGRQRVNKDSNYIID